MLYCLPCLGTLSAFKMLDASIVIHVAYNTTRDVRHDWHLLRHLASYPIALIPSPSYIPKHPVDCYYTYCSRSFVLLRSGSIHVSINTFSARQCCVGIVIHVAERFIRKTTKKETRISKFSLYSIPLFLIVRTFCYCIYYFRYQDRNKI